jgi:hypothetical protein
MIESPITQGQYNAARQSLRGFGAVLGGTAPEVAAHTVDVPGEASFQVAVQLMDQRSNYDYVIRAIAHNEETGLYGESHWLGDITTKTPPVHVHQGSTCDSFLGYGIDFAPLMAEEAERRLNVTRRVGTSAAALAAVTADIMSSPIWPNSDLLNTGFDEQVLSGVRDMVGASKQPLFTHPAIQLALEQRLAM